MYHSLAFTVGQGATNREFGKSAGVRLLLLAPDVLTAPMPKSKPLNLVIPKHPESSRSSSQMGLHKALQTRKPAGIPSPVFSARACHKILFENLDLQFTVLTVVEPRFRPAPILSLLSAEQLQPSDLGPRMPQTTSCRIPPGFWGSGYPCS